MFSIGDKVLYPMHGAGTIVNIEEKKILGEKQAYYIFELPSDTIDVMIPVDSGEAIGIRAIVDCDTAKKAIEVLKKESTDMDENWNRRYRENTEKLKTGDILLTAEVVRNLSRMAKVRTLSQGERKMLANAQTILSSELILVLGLSPLDADKLIETSISSVQY